MGPMAAFKCVTARDRLGVGGMVGMLEQQGQKYSQVICIKRVVGVYLHSGL